MPNLYIICGFLGAGKTTFSKQLAQEKRALHLNPDEWCVKLFSKDEYENNWDKCFDETIDFLWKKAKEAINDDMNVVFDMGFWNKNSRDLARKKSIDIGAEPILYYIYAPDEILKERISQRTGIIAENNLKKFDELKKYFEEPTKDENFIKIDNF